MDDIGDIKVIAREELLKHIKEHGVMRGNFKMASGQVSDLMIDLSRPLRTGHGQMLLAASVAKLLPRDIVVGGPLSGSDLVCAAIVSTGIAERWFGVRKEPKGRGFDLDALTGNIRHGDSVWLVEDVCTIGTTLSKAAIEVVKFGAKIDGVFAVVDRGGLERVANDNGCKKASLFTLDDFKL